jgi:NADH dehydrogenase
MILVVGATGSLGQKIARGLLDRGETVHALARPSSNWPPLEAAGARVAFGDLKQPASLERACEGADVVITTASISKTGDDSVENVDLQGNRNLVDSARASGVGHMIFVSTVGASTSSPVPVFRAKGETEELLREGGMAHTILQPDPFMDVWFGMLIERPMHAGEPVTLVGESLRRHAFVAEKDVAAFAIASTRTAAARNATLVLGGPEAVSFTEVVRAYEEATGRPIPVRRVAPGDPIPGIPEPVWGIAAALESYDSVIPMKEMAQTFGVTLTSVLDFARSRVAGPVEPGAGRQPLRT